MTISSGVTPAKTLVLTQPNGKIAKITASNFATNSG